MTKKEFTWDELSHYNLFEPPIKCSCCGKKRKRMFRMNYPRASNSSFDEQKGIPQTKDYPHNREPYDDWRCLRCWRHCPSLGECEFKKKEG